MKVIHALVIAAVIIAGIAFLAWVLYDTYNAAINVLEAM